MGLSEYLSDIQVLTLIVASAAHDFDHDGNNNLYHKNAR